jgi:hypothetical protein
MLVNLNWGPVGGQKRHARMAFLPPTPLKYNNEHTFLNGYGYVKQMVKYNLKILH